MRFTSRAIVAALVLSTPLAIFGQVQTLSITNYQLVSGVPASGAMWQLTYRADIANGPIPWGAVTATIQSLNPFYVRVLPNNNILNFVAVPANSQVTSTNTFTVLADPSVPLDTTKISWSFKTTAQAPVANAGPNQTVALGAKVVLDGSGSTDPSGTGTLTYHWTFGVRPAGTNSKLTSTAGVKSGFTVDIPGDYNVNLTVSNGTASSSASVTISTNNTPPVANAGQGQFVNFGAVAQLNGTGSTDVDGNPLTYNWTLISAPAGSAAFISNPTYVLPTLTTDLPGTYVVQLIVNDGKTNSAPATVKITTNPAAVPTAFAGQSSTVPHNSTFTLQGVGTDPQGKPLIYTWTLLTKPAGSIAAISNANIPQPTLFLDRPGIFVAQLIVSNGTDVSLPSTVTISTSDTPPVANAGTNQNALVGRTVFLDGSGSFDSDNDPLSYTWTFASRPAGSSSSLNAANGVVPNFIPDVPGVYVVQLMVIDAYASGVPSTVTITATAPVAITLTPSPLALSASPATLTVTLSASAGPNGAVISLTSSNTTAATVPAAVTVLSGKTTASVTVTPGTVTGSTTITASSPNMTTGTATINFTEPAAIILSVNPVSVGAGQQAKFPVSLSIPAPGPSGVIVTLLSSDITKAKLQSVTIPIPAGATAPLTQPVISGVNMGGATITASAPGFPTVSQKVNVIETVTFYPNNISLPFASSRRYTWVILSGSAPVGGMTLNVSSDNPAVATVPATITIPAGATQVQMNVTGVSIGTTFIHASLPPFVPDSAATVTIGQ